MAKAGFRRTHELGNGTRRWFQSQFFQPHPQYQPQPRTQTLPRSGPRPRPHPRGDVTVVVHALLPIPNDDATSGGVQLSSSSSSSPPPPPPHPPAPDRRSTPSPEHVHAYVFVYAADDAESASPTPEDWWRAAGALASMNANPRVPAVLVPASAIGVVFPRAAVVRGDQNTPRTPTPSSPSLPSSRNLLARGAEMNGNGNDE